jgi:soluble cytochrome b562
MSYRFLASLLAVLAVAFLAAGVSQSQENKPQDQPKDEKQDDTKRDDESKQKPEEPPKPMTRKEFSVFMDEQVKGEWNRLRIMERRRMGERAAEAADKLVELAPQMLRYDGEVLRGESKGEKAREQKDFKDWVDSFRKQAEEYARLARAGDWDKAAEVREEVNKTCNACHDAYEP